MINLHFLGRVLALRKRDDRARVVVSQHAAEDYAIERSRLKGRAVKVPREGVVAGVATVAIGVGPTLAERVTKMAVGFVGRECHRVENLNRVLR